MPLPRANILFTYRVRSARKASVHSEQWMPEFISDWFFNGNTENKPRGSVKWFPYCDLGAAPPSPRSSMIHSPPCASCHDIDHVYRKLLVPDNSLSLLLQKLLKCHVCMLCSQMQMCNFRNFSVSELWRIERSLDVAEVLKVIQFHV